MLLIGDIHINYKEKEGILDSLKEMIQQHPDEKNIIFLGDYVFSFNYERQPLLELYHFFVSLYWQGKNVYVLAWNHDRIKENFVFEEGRTTCEMFQNQETSGVNHCLKFITEPLLEEIEGEKFLFLPHTLDFDVSQYPWIEEFQDINYHALIEKENKNLTLSAKANTIIAYFKAHEHHFTVLHHYYFEWTKFPGQNSTFLFKDAALDHKWLDDPELSFISWHLHKPFNCKNYLCLGSIWATSSTESNQIKWYWTYHQGKYDFYEIGLKYYFVFDKREEKGNVQPLSEQDLVQFYENLQIQTKENMIGKNIDFHFLNTINLKTINVTCLTSDLNYEQEHVKQLIDPNLQKELHDFHLKKEFEKSEITLEGIENSEQLKLGMLEWKNLLKELIQKKYPEQYQEYEDLLRALSILK